MRPSSGIAFPEPYRIARAVKFFVVRRCDLRTCLQHRRTTAVQQFVASLAWFFMTSNSSCVSLPGLSRM